MAGWAAVSRGSVLRINQSSWIAAGPRIYRPPWNESIKPTFARTRKCRYVVLTGWPIARAACSTVHSLLSTENKPSIERTLSDDDIGGHRLPVPHGKTLPELALSEDLSLHLAGYFALPPRSPAIEASSLWKRCPPARVSTFLNPENRLGGRTEDSRRNESVRRFHKSVKVSRPL